jgi:hypothetical protein
MTAPFARQDLPEAELFADPTRPYAVIAVD